MSKSGIKSGANSQPEYEMKFMRTIDQVENKLWHEIDVESKNLVKWLVWSGLRSQMTNKFQRRVSDIISFQLWDKS